eukprot:Lankesteria_metandrocarpae@DN9263_c0_g1_i1.p2
MPLWGSRRPSSRRAAFTRHLRKLRVEKVTGSRIRCIGQQGGTDPFSSGKSLNFTSVLPFDFFVHKSIPSTDPEAALQDALGSLFSSKTGSQPSRTASSTAVSAKVFEKSNPLEYPANAN